MEAVATAGVEVLVQNLINFLKEEYSLLRGLEEDAEQLQETLKMIQAYLSDAEKKSTTEAVKIWLRQLEAVAIDADNVLDELNYHFLYKEVRKMDAPKPKNKVLSCLSSCSRSRISRCCKMAHNIKQINVNFKSVNIKATQLGLQNILANALPAVVDTSDETDSFSIDPIFIGRDDDVPKLVDILTQTHPKDERRMFSIVALVGMGGMGKTTLTKKVFNHEKVKARFGSLIWVHVSQKFDPINLFKKIHYKLTKRATDGVESRDDILEKLEEALKDKTYLLVLDDIWNEDVHEWEGFMNSMSGVTSTLGNGIIITTRSLNVASIVKPLKYTLRGLSDEDCWTIIKEKAFDVNEEVPPQFEIIGKRIAEACQGLPLAANVVGGVLRRCKSEEDWRLISVNCLSVAEGAERIKDILKLSYNYLPSPSLKKCFAYCSIFPKGDMIIKHQLIEQWMAEGFLQPDERNEMEDVGNKFFSILMHNSLMQVAKLDGYGNEEICVMHDLVHDLASSVLSSNVDGSTPVRYMFLEEESSHISKEVAKHLRTLFLKVGSSGINFQTSIVCII